MPRFQVALQQEPQPIKRENKTIQMAMYTYLLIDCGARLTNMMTGSQ